MAEFLTVVIQLPEGKESRKQIASALQLDGNFHGGRVTAMSLEDELTLNEQLIELCDPSLVEEAQKNVAKIHQGLNDEDPDQDDDQDDGPNVTDMYGDPLPDVTDDDTLSPKGMDEAERRSGQRE